MKELTFKISGFTCEACAKICRLELGNISGVKSVEVDFPSGQTNILAERDIPVEEITHILSELGYSIKK